MKKCITKWLWLSLNCGFAYLYGLLFGYILGISKDK